MLGSLPDVHLLQFDTTAPQAVVYLENNLDCTQSAIVTSLNGHCNSRLTVVGSRTKTAYQFSAAAGASFAGGSKNFRSPSVVPDHAR